MDFEGWKKADMYSAGMASYLIMFNKVPIILKNKKDQITGIKGSLETGEEALRILENLIIKGMLNLKPESRKPTVEIKKMLETISE